MDCSTKNCSGKTQVNKSARKKDKIEVLDMIILNHEVTTAYTLKMKARPSKTKASKDKAIKATL